MFEYEGKMYKKDPRIATYPGVEQGPRVEDEGDWWYNGHPCMAYLADTNQHGLNCSGGADGGAAGMCGPCAQEFKAFLKADRSMFDAVQNVVFDIMDELKGE